MADIKEPPQGGRPIRGKSNDAFTIPQTGYNGYIPPIAFNSLEHELAGLVHGSASLELYIKDGHLLRYKVSRERSFIPGKPTTGGVHNE